MKNFVVALAIVAIVGAGTSFAAPVSAQSIGDLQAQIRELLSKVSDLTKQLNTMQGKATTTASSPFNPLPVKHRICNILARNLAQGTQGDDVKGLQEFLSTEGHLSANATGFFGPATRAAVARWQAKEGISAAGSFGPMSRERIKMWCGGMGGDRFGATPQRGEAPLEVTFKTNVEVANPRFVADAGDYKIVFGDGNEEKISCTESEGFCKGPHTVKHTYKADGTYTATLVHYGYFGPPGTEGGMPSQVVGRAQIYVGEKIACTKEYKPVCGEQQIVCITTPCNPIQKTYGNRCMMEADGAKFLHEGACRPDNANPEKDLRCKAWYDGCNTCSRETPNGPAMCTLRACTQESMTKPYCTAWFDGKSPVVSSFSGPTKLDVNQTGTWTVKASEPGGGSLTYDVSWGDEINTKLHGGLRVLGSNDSSIQTTTFTHAYNAVGTYTITITASNSSGKEAKTSSTVYVGKVQPVACTMDAKQCPDGTYVGRTGPKCEFVCN